VPAFTSTADQGNPSSSLRREPYNVASRHPERPRGPLVLKARLVADVGARLGPTGDDRSDGGSIGADLTGLAELGGRLLRGAPA
jgi:hypothetical protein